MKQTRGEIRVGRCTYDKAGARTDPSFPGFTPIIVLTKSSAYGALGPYELKDEKGEIMENHWQKCKVYATIPASKQTYSRYDKTVIWDHPAETHAIFKREPEATWQVLPAYFAWREKLEKAPKAVRYPVGFNHRHRCLFSLAERSDGVIDPTPLDYIAGRKVIYAPLYERLARKCPLFAKLQVRLNAGESLCVIEVDGPHQEALDYYVEKYGVSRDFIENGTMLATPQNLSIMLNDEKFSYGHGYVLAGALLDLHVE